MIKVSFNHDICGCNETIKKVFKYLRSYLNSEVFKVSFNHDIGDSNETIKKVFKYLRRYS